VESFLLSLQTQALKSPQRCDSFVKHHIIWILHSRNTIDEFHQPDRMGAMFRLQNPTHMRSPGFAKEIQCLCCMCLWRNSLPKRRHVNVNVLHGPGVKVPKLDPYGFLLKCQNSRVEHFGSSFIGQILPSQ
jgi:hypothetical protein